MKKKTIIKIVLGALVVLGVVGAVFGKSDDSLQSKREPEVMASGDNDYPEELDEQPEVMASGDNDYPEYLDEESEEYKREYYDSISIDELLDELDKEMDNIVNDAINEVLDPQEQFVYGLQNALGSYVDSVYKQYGDPTRTASSINAEIELDKYFTDLYYYEDIKSEDDLISSIENSKFRSVCDRTIGDALKCNLTDLKYYIEENPNNSENVYVTYTGIDEDSGMKYTIRFEVFDNMCIGVNSVYCNNRSVGGIEDVLAAVEYILR